MTDRIIWVAIRYNKHNLPAWKGTGNTEAEAEAACQKQIATAARFDLNCKDVDDFITKYTAIHSTFMVVVPPEPGAPAPQIDSTLGPEDIPGVEHDDEGNVLINDPKVFDKYIAACGWEGGRKAWEEDTKVKFKEIKGKWFTFMGGPEGTRVFTKD
jgi:hypothetical protein